MLTKKQQTSSNRLRPKKVSTFGTKKSKLKKVSSTNKAKATKEDLDYMDWLHSSKCSFVCIVCESPNVEFHHVKRDSTSKKDHKRLIPLCQQHHTLSDKLSAHGTPKKWRETYSMELQYIIADKIYKNYLEGKQNEKN